MGGGGSKLQMLKLQKLKPNCSFSLPRNMKSNSFLSEMNDIKEDQIGLSFLRVCNYIMKITIPNTMTSYQKKKKKRKL